MVRSPRNLLIIKCVLLLSCCPPAVVFAQQAIPEASQDVSPRQYVHEAQGRQAYGIYLAGRKVGWFVEELKLSQLNDQEVAVLNEEFHFSITFAGEKSVFMGQEEKMFELEGEGQLLRGSLVSVEDGSKTETKAKREADKLKITTQTGGRTTERTSPVPRASLRRQQAFKAWLQSEPEPGATFENFSISLDQADIEVPENYTIKQKKTIAWGGVPVTAYDVSLTVMGVSVDATLSATGRILRGKIAALLELRAEEEVTAKKLDAGGVDMLAASAITVDRDLGDPEKVRMLTMKAKQLGDLNIPASHRQVVNSDDKDVAVVKLLRDHRVDMGEPLSDEARGRWTAASPTLLSDHQDIQELARAIAGDAPRPLPAAGSIKDWIQANLRPSYAANGSTALEVLANRSGDCTEHALLFVALARAAGIPAREVGGVVYIGGARLFGWHAWAEIHDGHQWVSVDPMWDQIYVDATHFKLSEGPDDFNWINALGRLQLEVVEFESDE